MYQTFPLQNEQNLLLSLLVAKAALNMHIKIADVACSVAVNDLHAVIASSHYLTFSVYFSMSYTMTP